jgi:hypothetical protein
MIFERYIKEEIDNLEQKMPLAETAQDIWYIIDRAAHALHNDSDLGKYIRETAKRELNKTLKKN